MRSENEIIDEIRCLAKRIRGTRLSNFNAFQVAAPKWRHENYHSRIIAQILNPCSGHGHGELFLNVFLNFLKRVAEQNNLLEVKKNLEYFAAEKSEVGVDTEVPANTAEMKGRVDILLRKGRDIIIIENKINGAPDCENQLERYGTAYLTDNVVAIVYLTAYQTPRSALTTGEVRNRLIRITGVGKCSLINGWLDECIENCKDELTKSVLIQYVELLKMQSNAVESDDDCLAVIKDIGEIARLNQFNRLTDAEKRVADNIKDVDVEKLFSPAYVLARFVERSCEYYDFSPAHIWREGEVDDKDLDTVYYPLVLLDSNGANGVELALDLNCNYKSKKYGISLHRRYKCKDPPQSKIVKLEQAVGKVMGGLDLKKERRGKGNERYWKNLPPILDVYCDPYFHLVNEMDKLLKAISEKKGVLEEALF